LQVILALLCLWLAGHGSIIPSWQRIAISAQWIRKPANAEPAQRTLAVPREVSLDEIGNADVIPFKAFGSVDGQNLDDTSFGVRVWNLETFAFIGKL
jgi:hypothetical protein